MDVAAFFDAFKRLRGDVSRTQSPFCSSAVTSLGDVGLNRPWIMAVAPSQLRGKCVAVGTLQLALHLLEVIQLVTCSGEVGALTNL